jgi:DNA-binding response OmpR family regulator
MPRATVLIVEDDAAIRRAIADMLTFAGYQTLQASDGAEGLDRAVGGAIDLVLLDILMPKRDGLSVLTELRKAKPSLPVIFLTAKGEESDRVKGLRLGADDYVVKPFGPQELLARVEAVLRRTPERPRTIGTLTLPGLTIHFERREVAFADGRRAPLSQRESEVLAYLAANPGRAVSRDELLQRVWGVDPRGAPTRAIDMTIARLREILGDDPANPRVVVTVRGTGYMLAAPPPPAPAPSPAPALSPNPTPAPTPARRARP